VQAVLGPGDDDDEAELTATATDEPSAVGGGDFYAEALGILR
jgi:hypothetical protein